MTELLQRAITEIEKLPKEVQDTIAARILEELEDEHAWKIQFETTTAEQWDKMAEAVHQSISTGDTFSLDEILPHEDLTQ
ncbi:MAG: hypothetical protein C4527_16060 [Candidatus Omnitrophota bacterium]|jgi:mRNA-degrading endonuclease RelE of RelBE toxin-antitoxin system|nr:MAG: hypothetical protein C4527_16060 [Candidatus Omnitrophota bacterium]